MYCKRKLFSLVTHPTRLEVSPCQTIPEIFCFFLCYKTVYSFISYSLYFFGSYWTWKVCSRQWRMLVRNKTWIQFLSLLSSVILSCIFLLYQSFSLRLQLFFLNLIKLCPFHLDTIPFHTEQESQLTGCRCPQGFQGDGHQCEGA